MYVVTWKILKIYFNIEIGLAFFKLKNKKERYLIIWVLKWYKRKYHKILALPNSEIIVLEVRRDHI